MKKVETIGELERHEIFDYLCKYLLAADKQNGVFVSLCQSLEQIGIFYS